MRCWTRDWSESNLVVNPGRGGILRPRVAFREAPFQDDSSCRGGHLHGVHCRRLCAQWERAHENDRSGRFVAAASLLATQSNSSVAAKITALEKAWNQAYKAADRRALDAIRDDHVVLTDDDGSTQTKAALLASLFT
jgi:Domain of unknown function (DUF4440)